MKILPKMNSNQVEVHEAENEFMAANPDGVISKKKFILSMKVINICGVWGSPRVGGCVV